MNQINNQNILYKYILYNEITNNIDFNSNFNIFIWF